jgi:hypothetical protein
VLAVPPRLCAGERSAPPRICAGSGTMPVRSTSSCEVGATAAAVIVVLAPPVAMPAPDVLAQDVPELLAAVDSVVFDDVDGAAAVDEPRPVVPRAAVPRLEVPRLAIPCTTVLGEAFEAVSGEAFVAVSLCAVAVADAGVEAELALAVAAIPDGLTVGQGNSAPLVALDVPGGRPLIVVPTESVSPPPSKVGRADVPGLAPEQAVAMDE